MRRWNGWGDDSIRVDLPRAAAAYLRERIGTGAAVRDATIESVLRAIPQSRLPAASFVDTRPETRLRHACGQSLPDWIALRFGRVERVPDGVVFPQNASDVRDALRFGRESGACVIPYGGGTSVAGHVNPPRHGAPVLTISMAAMRRLQHFEETSRIATFEAGVTGPEIEAQLQPLGYTLGHFPQSFEYSTLGGWIATKSCGQQSLRYGGIEQLFASAHVETPRAALEIPSFPASAAGLDVRGLVLGSEGRIGIITLAGMRVRPIAQEESFQAWFFRNWEIAREAARALVQQEVPLSMIRLADANETQITLGMAGRRGIALMEGLLAMRGHRDGKCMLIAGLTGSHAGVKRMRSQARDVAARHGGLYVGHRPGNAWKANRFRGVYLRNALWERGYAVDTIETAVDWPRVDATMRAMQAAARNALGNAVLAYAHLSHLYPQGSSVYGTFIFPLAPSFEENMARRQSLKEAVSRAIVQNGGTITHQHGIGTDHRAYLAQEKGELGVSAMKSLFATFDPDGMMNPEKLC